MIFVLLFTGLARLQLAKLLSEQARTGKRQETLSGIFSKAQVKNMTEQARLYGTVLYELKVPGENGPGDRAHFPGKSRT